MIEINLSPTKKAGGIANFGGINLSLINVKMMVFALVIWFVPEPILIDIWDGEIQSNREQYQKLDQEFKKLQQKVKSLQSIQKQVDALIEQEEKLARKLETVKQIINKRQNPYIVFKYIAENIPSDVWITSIVMNENALVIRGYGKSWKDIGTLLEALKKSIFFSRQFDYTRPQEMKNEFRGQRVEVFEIKVSIARFK